MRALRRTGEDSRHTQHKADSKAYRAADAMFKIQLLRKTQRWTREMLLRTLCARTNFAGDEEMALRARQFCVRSRWTCTFSNACAKLRRTRGWRLAGKMDRNRHGCTKAQTRRWGGCGGRDPLFSNGACRAE